MSRAENFLSAPPIAIAGASLFGLSLPEWAAVITIIYTLILIFFRLRSEFKKRWGKDDE